jgi:hypothetical protein
MTPITRRDLFDLWLFTPGKPPPEAVSPPDSAARSVSQKARSATRTWLHDLNRRLARGAY